MTYLNPKITPTRRRVRMSKYIAQVNTVGANVGAKLLYFNFIDIKQLLSTVMWRKYSTLLFHNISGYLKYMFYMHKL